MVKAGSYIWVNKKGWTRNIQLDKVEFSRLFNCKAGQLKKGISYTFLTNYRYGDERYGGDALWFVIAMDKNGKSYKGVSIVETESTLKQQQQQ